MPSPVLPCPPVVVVLNESEPIDSVCVVCISVFVVSTLFWLDGWWAWLQGVSWWLGNILLDMVPGFNSNALCPSIASQHAVRARAGLCVQSPPPLSH